MWHETDENFDDGGTPAWRARHAVLPRRCSGPIARIRRRIERMSVVDAFLLPLRFAIWFTLGAVGMVALLITLGVLKV